MGVGPPSAACGLALSRKRLLGAGRFAAGAGGQGEPRVPGNVVADEADGAVGEQQVDAAGVPAAGGPPAVGRVHRRRLGAVGHAVGVGVVGREVVVVGGTAVLAADPLEAAAVGVVPLAGGAAGRLVERPRPDVGV